MIGVPKSLNFNQIDSIKLVFKCMCRDFLYTRDLLGGSFVEAWNGKIDHVKTMQVKL
jgi:hypothetical protein